LPPGDRAQPEDMNDITFSLALGGLVLALGAPNSTAPQTLRALYGLAPPPALSAAHTALVLVDFQQEFFTGRLPLRHGPAAAATAARLMTWARASGILVVNVRNVIPRPGSPTFASGSSTVAFVPALAPQPDDLTITKTTGGAFTRTALDAELHRRSIDTVIVAGLMTHLAVAITATDATVLGYHTIVAADATATRALPAADGGSPVTEALLQSAALAAMADRAADVLSASAILALPVNR
jgi:nicotinamidase-related amidase